MPTIFPPSFIENQHVPTVENLMTLNNDIVCLLRQAHARAEVACATSYGSLNRGIADRASDADWLIVMRDIESMFTSPVLDQIRIAHRECHVSWSSPVTTIETLKHGFHQLAPLFYGIKHSSNRTIIGDDPIILFQESATEHCLREAVRRILASSSRYTVEDLAIRRKEAQDDPDVTAASLQLAIDTFQAVYRSMIVLAVNGRNVATEFDFKTYSSFFDALLPDKAKIAGEKVSYFINMYRQRLQKYLYAVEVQNANIRKIANRYASFLQEHVCLSKDVATFIEANCWIANQ
jgi:hypothetical protein